MKIIRLQSENVKRLRVVDITPKPRKRRVTSSPGMRMCAHCKRIYPARALVVASTLVPAGKDARLCGTDALAIARKISGVKLSRLKVIARKSRLYNRKMQR